MNRKKMKQKIIIGLSILALILFSGCSNNIPCINLEFINDKNETMIYTKCDNHWEGLTDYGIEINEEKMIEEKKKEGWYYKGE